jgi:SSS family transporter
MSTLDWIVLFGTLVLIVAYGTWKTRGSRTIQSYLLGDKSMPWWSVGLSIMATQASAITFLSTPGQAFDDGMRFLQFYFGLPLAMVILCITAIPLYYKLKVYTAYEYLESRFDRKTRTLAAFFFLMLRGLSVAITIYAPSLILSTMLGWNIHITNLIIGGMVLIYTVSGGTKAVSLTQKYQLSIVMSGMILAGVIAVWKLPDSISFGDAVNLAGEMGKFNLIDLNFDLSVRYNIWSGLIGGLFLFMAYFGTDQSQVGRYLGGKDTTESRLGLIFNGLLKVPMQFIILFIGVMVFVFYQFVQPPVFHNTALRERALQTSLADSLLAIEGRHSQVFLNKREAVLRLDEALKSGNASAVGQASEKVDRLQVQEAGLRKEAQAIIGKALPGENTLDKDYVFINYVMTYLPQGLIGLLLAVVFSAAMSSTASELNALASTTTVDIYKRSIHATGDEYHYVKASRWFTLGWAAFAILFATFANQSENLIQFVNIVGSLFYGTILGIFITAFFVPFVKSRAVFLAAIIGELAILYCYFFTDIAFLLYNIIGCGLVVIVSIILQATLGKQTRP